MNRFQRIAIAQNTIAIIECGHYYFNKKEIDVKELITASRNSTFTVASAEWPNLQEKLQKLTKKTIKTVIECKNCTTVEALLGAKTESKIGILNFASAKNAGGGFLTGAMAQEESLARASSLYDAQTKSTLMYQRNREQSSYLYTDFLIYSPNVVFWVDDNGVFLETPVLADVITSPAPNKGAMLQNQKSNEIQKIEKVFRDRMEQVLAISELQGVEYLILGAWGCGVFRNEPAIVAQLFKEVLAEKFQNSFKKIVFAVFDTSDKQVNFKAFADLFN